MMDSTRTMADDRPDSATRSQPLSDIDLQQARVLIAISLKQALRPVPQEGGRGRRPLLRLAISMLIMGACFSASRRYAADVSTYFVGLFTAVLLITLTGVIPQAQVLRDRDFELLHSKPVSNATHRAAWIFLRFFYAWLLASSFSLIPLIRAVFSFEIAGGLVALTYLMLLLAGFSAVVLWMSVMMSLSRRVGIDNYRKATQSLNLLCMLGLMVPSMIVLVTGGPASVHPVSLSDLPLIHYFPPAWFARFFTGGFGQPAILERIGALLIAGAAFGLALSPRASRRYLESMERAAAIDDSRLRAPLGLRAAGWIQSLPGAGKWLIPEQTIAVMLVVLSSVQREEYSRLRMLSSRVLIVAFSIWCFIRPDPIILLLIAGWGYGTVTDGVELVKRCSQPGGAWVFRSSPLSSRNLERGIRLSVILKYFLLPGVLTSVALFKVQAPLAAAALSLTYFAMAGLLSSMMMVMTPALPLTQEATRTPVFWTLIAAWTFNITSVVLYFIQGFLFGMGTIGIAAFGLGFLVLCGVCYLSAMWASTRLAGVESPA